MSKIQFEFRELLEGILYTPLAIDTMTDTLLSVIYEGIEASYNERVVYRAFEVLTNGLSKNDKGHDGRVQKVSTTASTSRYGRDQSIQDTSAIKMVRLRST